MSITWSRAWPEIIHITLNGNGIIIGYRGIPPSYLMPRTWYIIYQINKPRPIKTIMNKNAANINFIDALTTASPTSFGFILLPPYSH
jgi:hypothetical protein